MTLLFLLACSPDPAPAAPSSRPPARVEVAPIQRGDLSDDWTMLGEVRALDRSELGAGAVGSVVRVDVREGDRVTAGQLLLEIDPALAAAELGTARAASRRLEVELEQARRTLGRVERVGDTVLAADELDRSRTSVATLEAQLEGARAAERLAGARLERHRVRAPYDGVLAERFALHVPAPRGPRPFDH